ncbi:helix-turn-helix transcriptional regulator [Colwellia sp. 20A7]|uniref:helix-turn-helix transcriptional regulator n=1 Tax=Colwellia sp. 20A7 TaxID=2689569 RepID=UPI00135CE0A7|nr:AlpA family phage regulatory protein [Colwellia sp. 20A7]
MKEKLILNINDITTLIGKSKSTLFRWVNAGIFPKPMKRGNHFIGWRREAINAWLVECEQEVA